ncbi:MAG: rhomboid family intramembrane serine protease [Lachnospiraceae bacterium]|nr:rhomboid family intramembrane serine protease [Lachnospiraceae bacterium]
MKNALKKIDYNSPVVLSFAFISFIVLILGFITGGWTTRTFFSVYRSSLADLFGYVRLFGHVLGHANLSHYVNNMMMLLLIGPMLEEKYGSKLLLEMILITAFVTGVLNNLLFPTGLLGASGIVFMMIILSSVTSVKEGKIPLTLIVVVILYLGDQIMAGVLSKDNISQLTHIIGGVCGGVFGMWIGRDPSLKD